MHVARPARRRAATVPTRDLDDLVAEESLRLDARHGVLAHAVGELRPIVRSTRTLPPGLGGQVHARDPADLHAGQTHGGALDETADLGELGVDGVARLEQARPRAQQRRSCRERRPSPTRTNTPDASFSARRSCRSSFTASPRLAGQERLDGGMVGSQHLVARPQRRELSVDQDGHAVGHGLASAPDRGSPRSQCRRRRRAAARSARPPGLELVGSRPAVGSSNSSISGSPISARAMPTRLRMPPDSSAGSSVEHLGAEPDHGQGLDDALVDLGVAQAGVLAQRIGHVLVNRQRVEQRGALKDVAHATADRQQRLLAPGPRSSGRRRGPGRCPAGSGRRRGAASPSCRSRCRP